MGRDALVTVFDPNQTRRYYQRMDRKVGCQLPNREVEMRAIARRVTYRYGYTTFRFSVPPGFSGNAIWQYSFRLFRMSLVREGLYSTVIHLLPFHFGNDLSLRYFDADSPRIRPLLGSLRLEMCLEWHGKKPGACAITSPEAAMPSRCCPGWPVKSTQGHPRAGVRSSLRSGR